MAITNLHRHFERLVRVAPVDPVDLIDFKIIRNQIFRAADKDAIRRRIKIDHVTRLRGAARQPFALTNREKLDASVFAEKISLEIVNAAGVKFFRTEMRTEKRLLIIPGDETNFLAVRLVRDLQA